MPEPIANNEQRTAADEALTAAWRYFRTYDKASISQKASQIRLRALVIALGVLISVLAVVVTYKDVPLIKTLGEAIHVVLIILPFVAAAIFTYASQLAPILSWVAHRVGAERVRREMYLYRMQAGDYAGKSPAEQKQWLLRQIKDINDRVTQTATPDYMDPIVPEGTALKEIVHTDTAADDGFSPMTAMEYIERRASPQLQWYRRRSQQDYKYMRRWRVGTLIIATVGSGVLAALRLEPLVAVAAALGVAINLYVNLQMYGHTYALYSATARRIKVAIDEWQISTPDKTDSHATAVLVSTVEAIFEAERETWMEAAIRAQTDDEQKLGEYVAKLRSASA